MTDAREEHEHERGDRGRAERRRGDRGGRSVRHVKVDIEGLHLTEYSVGPAPMGDLHTHERHTDAFYVLEGELEVATSETETVLVGPGGFAVAPPGAVHAFAV